MAENACGNKFTVTSWTFNVDFTVNMEIFGMACHYFRGDKLLTHRTYHTGNRFFLCFHHTGGRESRGRGVSGQHAGGRLTWSWRAGHERESPGKGSVCWGSGWSWCREG